MTAKLQHTSNRLTNDGGPASVEGSEFECKSQIVHAPMLEASASEQFLCIEPEVTNMHLFGNVR